MDWDNFYIGLARYVSQKSRDPSTKTGAVIVRPDNTVASLGYNGFAMRDCDDPKLYADRGTKLERIIHSEINAFVFCREPVKGYTMFSSQIPCKQCAPPLVQAGIRRFVFPLLPESSVSRWGAGRLWVLKYFKDCGIDWKEISDS